MTLVWEIALPLTIQLAVRDLHEDDLPNLAWSGDAKHLENVASQLRRAKSGAVDCLVVCPPSGLPIAKGGIDYEHTPGAATIFQLAVLPALQSCGIGALLIGAAEQRIRGKGLTEATLGVEVSNPRARTLYERLGYIHVGERVEAWDTARGRYETVCTVMRKTLANDNFVG